MSDYEHFLKTDELLSLQREDLCKIYPHMLTFMVVHQSSELWLKHTASKMSSAARLIDGNKNNTAAELIRSASTGIYFCDSFLTSLEKVPQTCYAKMRDELGNGSGFSSPGWRVVRNTACQLLESFQASISFPFERTAFFTAYSDTSEYSVFEAMLDLDSACIGWRNHHLRLVERLVGVNTVGTAGTPVRILKMLSDQKLFPVLWGEVDSLESGSMT